ncbi:unannotated protein [freshwater metagenome]|uniref:Unannotated protein n=1 Tax=freshwater metagenome TaxID=449393 RepID=A0A6J7GXV5_9ZZZZ
MGTALVRVDRVGEGVHRFGVTSVPLHGDLDLVALTLAGEADDRVVNRGLGAVDVLDEVHETVGVVVRPLAHLGRLRRCGVGLLFLGGFRCLGGLAEFLLGRVGGRHSLVGEVDGQSLVEERHLLQATVHGLEAVIEGLEDLAVGPEPHRGAGLRGVADGLEWAGLGVIVRLLVAVTVTRDLQFDLGRECVHDGDTDAVQTAGDGVGVGVELATGVQLGHDDLDGGNTGGVHGDGDAAAVVLDLDAAVFVDGDVDGGGVAGHGLVDGVVDDLPDQVVQASFTGGTDVHTGPLTDCFQALEDRDGRSAVILAVLTVT